MNKRRAVEAAFHRLGLQASTAQVVAELARYRIAVSEELVRLVRVGMLKDPAGFRRQQAARPKQLPRPAAHQFQKRPRRPPG